MNILITGNVLSLAKSLANSLLREGHKIVVASEQAEQIGIDTKKIILHSINPADKVFRDILSSYNFDVVVFISTREELLKGQDFSTGQQLDGLRSTLELCKIEKVKHMFYISSTEVYGKIENVDETVEPQPASVNGHTLLLGEQICNAYNEMFDVNTSIIRVPFIYGPYEHNTFLLKLIHQFNEEKNVILPAGRDTLCSMLHADDVSDFLIRATEEDFSLNTRIVNLSAANQYTLFELVNLLNSYFPNAKYDFDDNNTLYTRPVPVIVAKKFFDWVALRELNNELSTVVDVVKSGLKPSKYDWNWVLRELSNYQELFKWLELILGIALAQYLSDFTGIMIQFKYVDFRLLFVVLMSMVYGLRIGLIAATLAGASILYTWSRLGLDWTILAYNVGNWFPFAVYFAAGVVIGYTRDKKETEIDNEKKQTSLIYDKYKFLFEVFEEVRTLKDEFREQLLGYKDSFGKIYTVTRKLDALHEEDVFVNALSTLEDLMSNDTIAIYSLDSTNAFARLEVNSLSLNEKIDKSLKLEDFPEILKSTENGEVFQNTSLLPSYPAYVSPVYNNKTMMALVVIWKAKFDQYSMYYYNLFKVISGLIQDSLARASSFRKANLEKMYLPSTKVLTPEAFVDVLKRRVYMKKDKIANYQLLWVERGGRSIPELYAQISGAIRSVDIVGMRNDGNLFIVLPQADPAAIEEIIKRLKKLKVKCEPVSFLS